MLFSFDCAIISFRLVIYSVMETPSSRNPMTDTPDLLVQISNNGPSQTLQDNDCGCECGHGRRCGRSRTTEESYVTYQRALGGLGIVDASRAGPAMNSCWRFGSAASNEWYTKPKNEWGGNC